MMSGKDFLKSHVLSWGRKVYSDWKDVTSSGSGFQVFGPETGGYSKSRPKWSCRRLIVPFAPYRLRHADRQTDRDITREIWNVVTDGPQGSNHTSPLHTRSSVIRPPARTYRHLLRDDLVHPGTCASNPDRLCCLFPLPVQNSTSFIDAVISSALI